MTVNWVKWLGMTANKRTIYNAEAESYKKLYKEIQEKYGYGRAINENAIWLYLAEKLGLADEVNLTYGEMDFIKFFEIFEELDYHITEDDYKHAIYKSTSYESTSQAYYQDFLEFVD